jgi:hypothetical protein
MDNNDLSAACFQRGRTDGKGRYSFLYDEDFPVGVGVLVQSYRTTRGHVNPDK